MTFYILPIVEGQTEQKCLEKILHRVWRELLGQLGHLQVIEPFRAQRDRLIDPKTAVLETTVQKALPKLRAKAGTDDRLLMLILTDAEQDCPATLGPALLARAKAALPSEIDVSCVVAKRMLENWFVAGSSTLGGVGGLPESLPSRRAACEDISGKNWLENQIRSVDPTRKYKETVDSLEFAKVVNLAECRANSPSFDKLCRELEARIPPPEPTTSDEESINGHDSSDGTDAQNDPSA